MKPAKKKKSVAEVEKKESRRSVDAFLADVERMLSRPVLAKPQETSSRPSVHLEEEKKEEKLERTFTTIMEEVGKGFERGEKKGIEIE